jgi:hypothetical protein
MTSSVAPANAIAPAELEDSAVKWQVTAVWTMLIVSLLTWRKGAFYNGGLDPVVAAKALLVFIGLAISLNLMRRLGPRHVIGVTSVCLVSSYLVVTLIGSLAQGSPFASLILAIRVGLVAVTVACLVVTCTTDTVLSTFTNALTGIAVLLAVTGTTGGESRLQGRLLPVSPNQLALLLGPPIILSLWRLLQGRARRFEVPLVTVLLLLALATGSRTSLLGLLLAVFILVVMAPTVGTATFLGATVGAPALFYLVAFTPLASHYVNREGQGKITTLNSRTIAWQSAFAGGKSFWENWFGGGLAIKTVAVTGSYWQTQVLDSSWVSAYVQAGVLGMILLGLWALATVWRSATSPLPHRSVLLAMAAYVLVRSFLENGLLDAYALNVLMLVPALLAEARPVHPPGDAAQRSPRPPAAGTRARG